MRTFLNLLSPSEDEERFDVAQPLEVRRIELTYRDVSLTAIVYTVFRYRHLVCSLCWDCCQWYRVQWGHQERGCRVHRTGLEWQFHPDRHQKYAEETVCLLHSCSVAFAIVDEI